MSILNLLIVTAEAPGVVSNLGLLQEDITDDEEINIGDGING